MRWGTSHWGELAPQISPSNWVDGHRSRRAQLEIDGGHWARRGEEVSGSAHEIIATVFVAFMISVSAAQALASPHPQAG